MSSLPKTARQRKDYITTRRIELERDRFISSISKEDVCRLATSLNSGIGCDYFQEPVRGSYNVCYFVQFGQPGPSPERWVVRVPIAPCLAAGTSSKLESEVVAMQYAYVAAYSLPFLTLLPDISLRRLRSPSQRSTAMPSETGPSPYPRTSS